MRCEHHNDDDRVACQQTKGERLFESLHFFGNERLSGRVVAAAAGSIKIDARHSQFQCDVYVCGGMVWLFLCRSSVCGVFAQKNL